MPIDLRQQLLASARRLAPAGLNRGTAGNLSVRAVEGGVPGYLITPSGMDYDRLTPDDLVFMDMDGRYGGRRKPSSEWLFHRELHARRPEISAVVHVHSPFATSLACLRRDIPPFHYMIARFGGDSLRCAEYATFGTQTLADHACAALQGRTACLLANHGLLVVGQTLAEAFALTVEAEELCEHYWRACQMGTPVVLDAQEMATVIARFATYGQQGQGA